MTSSGSKTHGRDIRGLQNSKRTNKVQVGNKKRSVRKSRGWTRERDTCAMNCHGWTQGAFIKAIVSSSSLSCWLWSKANYRKYHLMHCEVALSSVCSGWRSWQRPADAQQRTRRVLDVPDRSLRTSLFWGVNQQHSAGSLQHTGKTSLELTNHTDKSGSSRGAVQLQCVSS